jgi:hypothetical protein
MRGRGPRAFATIIALLISVSLPGVAGGALTPPSSRIVMPLWATTVTGRISTDMTWTAAESPYLVEGQLAVDAGVTLTVEPGVEVRFAPSSQVLIRGHISAVGTSAAPIQFLGVDETAGSWGGISVLGSGTDPVSATFEHATIAHGGGPGGYGAQVYVYSGTLALSDSTVRDGSGDGITAEFTGLSLTSVEVTNNAGAAVRLVSLSDSARPALEALSLSGNGTNAVSLENAGTQRQDLHLTAIGVPYRVAGQLIVAPGATLTVDPGVEVRFEAAADLIVNGAIVAEGTPEKPIQFLGVDETPGSWAGIELLSGNEAVVNGSFANVTIANAGGSGGRGTQLYAYAGSLKVSDSQIRDGAGVGIIGELADLDLSSVAITGNAGLALEVIGQSGVPPARQPRFDDLTITGNGTDVVAIDQPGALMTDAHWTALSVPYRVSGQLVVPPDLSWAVDPGVEIEFAAGSEAVVRGSMSAIGTAEQPIAFRGVERTPGSWLGIEVVGSGAAGAVSRFEHVSITDAGGSGGAGAALYVADGRTVFNDGEISNAAGDGVHVSGLAPFGPSRVEGSQLVEIGGVGVANDASVLMVATNNWWGDPSGPAAANECVTGTGTSISGLIRYAPWLGAEDAAPDPLAVADRPVITLVPQRWYAPADGQTRIWVDLTLRDPDGLPVPGATITLSSTFGDVTSGGTTDAAGHTLAWLTSFNPGDAQLTAYLSDKDACDEADVNEAMVTFTENADNLLQGMEAPYLYQGIEVGPEPLTRGVESTLRATIVNPSEQPLQIEVEFETADYGIGLVFGPIGERQTKEIPAGGEVTFETTWVPQVTGHVCVQVLYHVVGASGGGAVAAIGWPPIGIDPGFAAPGSGGGQRNLNIYGGGAAGGGGGAGGKGGGGGKPPLDKAKKATDGVGMLGGPFTAIQRALVKIGLGSLFDKAGTASEQLGGDPPRQDYTEVATLEPVTIDFGERPNDISQAHFDAVVALGQALVAYNAAADAAIVSYDRYGGASAAQDLHWASVQMSSLIHYRKQAGLEATKVADAIAGLQDVLAAESADATLTVEDATSYLARLQSDGFNAEELASLHEVGLSDESIAALLAERIATSPEELAGSLSDRLADAEEAMRELGPYLGAEVNFPDGSATAPTSALFGDVAQAADASKLARVYDVAATLKVGNPLDHPVTVELRLRPISLPAGWPATVSPTTVQLAPGEEVTATVVISPSGPTAQGTIARVAVEGFAEDTLLGGVVVGLLVPEAVPFGEVSPTTGGVPALPLLGVAAVLAVLAVGGGAWYVRRRRVAPPKRAA